MAEKKAEKPQPRKIPYLCCPFCGRTRPTESLSPEKTKLVEPYTWKLLQIRQRGKGQRGGFVVVPEESLTLRQLMKRKEYTEFLDALKFRFIEIATAWYDMKFLKREDVEHICEEQP